MDFGEGDAKFRTSQQRQVHIITAVHQVDDYDLVKRVMEGDPGGTQQTWGTAVLSVFQKKKKRVPHLDCSETLGVTMTTKLRVVP